MTDSSSGPAVPDPAGVTDLARPEGFLRVAQALAAAGHPHAPVWLDVAARTSQEAADALEETGCSLDFEGGPGIGQLTPVGEVKPVPVSIESFHVAKKRALADRHAQLQQDGSDL